MKHRHHNPASGATDTGAVARSFGPSEIAWEVGDIARSAIANGLGVWPLGLELLWENAPHGALDRVVAAGEAGELDLMARVPGHVSPVPPQQAGGVALGRAHHRL